MVQLIAIGLQAVIDFGYSSVMRSATPLICDAVVDCVGSARSPTAVELHIVAERIWSESHDTRSVFRWSDLPLADPERAGAFRAAHVALCGDEAQAG